MLVFVGSVSGYSQSTFTYHLGDPSVTLDACDYSGLVLMQVHESLLSSEQGSNDRVLSVQRGNETDTITLLNYADCEIPIMLENQPNIIIIFADDLGYGDLGVYGQELIQTPNLDQMATDGMLFTDFYSGATHCPPARSVLMTGQHTGHTFVRNAGYLSADLTLLPDVMQGAGYHTGMFGKWGMTGFADTVPVEGLPNEVGFNEFVGTLTHRDAHAYFLDGMTDKDVDGIYPEFVRDYLYRIDESGEVVEYPVAPTRYTQNEYRDQALGFIERNQGTPFFLYLPWTIPHAEIIVPQMGDPDYAPEDQGLYEQYLDADGNSIFPEVTVSEAEFYNRPNENTRAMYAGMISRLDRDVGMLLDKLDELGLSENTLVIFTSDNGPHTEDGMDPRPYDALLDTPFNSTGGLRGFKRSLYEGGIRVPLLVQWRGTIPAGQVSSEPTALWDIFPTMLDVSNIPSIEGLDGISLFPLLTGQEFTPHDYLYWENFETFGQAAFEGQAIRMGDWKAVRVGLEDGDDQVALYNLADDPAESTDLSAEQCPLVNQMKGLMNSARTVPELDPELYEIPQLNAAICA